MSSSSSSFSSYHHFSFFSLYENDQFIPPSAQNPTLIPIPIQSPANPTTTPTPITVTYPPSILATAAARIQSRYRSHLIRSLFLRIRSVNSQTDRLQALIQRQETVDSIRTDEKERLRLNEELMGVLLGLDSVPGHFDENVRMLRRKVSRRIVGLQEILDAIAEERIDDGGGVLVVPRSWGEFVEKICSGEEEEGCAETESRKGLVGLRCFEEYVMGL